MLEILFSAFVGAVAAGLFQTIADWRNRRRNAEATLTAIACEVDSICRLIGHQRYIEAYEQAAQSIADGTWAGETWIIDVRANYFTVYEALASSLGHLDPHHLIRIVNFYAYCKSAIDSTRPDGPAASSTDAELLAEGIQLTLALLRSIMALGNEISQFPRSNIHDSIALKLAQDHD